jgi:hypothetical protein
MPGEFVFGQEKAAQDLKITVAQVRTCLNRLKTTGNLTVKTTNKFSIISVVNWDVYQGTFTESDHQSSQQNDQQATSNRPASDHIQEVKKLKKNIYTEEDLAVAQQIHSSLLKENSEYPAVVNANLGGWAEEVRKLRAIDHFPHEKILEVCQWAMQDSFWSKQFLSVLGLRKKSDNNGLSKFENMMSGIKSSTPKINNVRQSTGLVY